MPRPPSQPPRSSIAPEELPAYDRMVRRGLTPMGKDFPPDGSPDEEYMVHPYGGALMNSPDMAAAVGHMGSLGRMAADYGNTFEHWQREWIDQVLCYHWNWFGFMPRHTLDGIATGVRVEAIEALRDGRWDDMTDEERLLARFILQIESGTVDDETWDAAEALMGKRGVVEYAIFTCQLILTGRLMQAFAANEPSMTRDEVTELIERIKSGEQELPDWRKWIRPTT